MIYLIALILILLIVTLFILFYAPRTPKRRRPVHPVVLEQELAPDEVAEVRTGTEPEQELTLEISDEELILEKLAGRPGEEPSPAVDALEAEAPAATPVIEEVAALGGVGEEIPYIVEEEHGATQAEGEVAPALAGFGEEGEGIAEDETPGDLAQRLDLFFGGEEEEGEGPATETALEEGGADEAEIAEAQPAEEESPGAVPEAEIPAGPTPEQYEAGLRQVEARLRRELDAAIGSRETGKLRLLESELTAVCGRLDQLPASLEHHLRLLAELEEVLAEIAAALPGFQSELLRRNLRGGDLEVARAMLAEAAQQLPEAGPLAARLRFLGGRLAEEQAEFGAAAELYRQAGTAASDPAYLFAAGRMARMLGDDEAAQRFLAALLAAESDNGIEDLARHELARVHLLAEEKEQAEPLLIQALAGLEQRLGAENPALGPVLLDLAALHESSGQYEQAEPLYRRAVAVTEQALGPEHPQLAATLSKLAGLYEEMEQEDQAQPLYERALAIRKRVLGENHPDIGLLLNHLANLHKQRGDYGKAEPMFLSALEIAENALGTDHPNLTVILNNLAELYEETGNEEKAQEYQERAFALFELPGGGDFVEMAKDEIEIDDEQDKTITGS